MGLAYMQPMTLFVHLVSFQASRMVMCRQPMRSIDCDPVYGSELREAGSPLSFAGSAYTYAQKSISPTVGFMGVGLLCSTICSRR